MSDITKILSAIVAGDPRAAEELLPLVYDELRKLAAGGWPARSRGRRCRRPRWCTKRICGWRTGNRISNGIVGAISSAPRPRPCGGYSSSKPVTRKASRPAGSSAASKSTLDIWRRRAGNVDLIALDEALTKLATIDRRKAGLVKLRFFAGLTIRQAAEALDMAESTADADWAYAKSWLRVQMTDTLD